MKIRRTKREETIERIQKAEIIEADFMRGLSDKQVRARETGGLVNKTPKKVTKTYWRIFVDNIFTFFNVFFLAIAIMMMFAKVDISYYFFLAPIFGNIILGVLADVRARRLVDKLRLVTDPKTLVMRNGKESSIRPADLVLGDIVVLKAGDQVCADAIIVNGNMEADESLLSGESVPVKKEIGSEVFSGSYVKNGKAYARVSKVGLANYAETLQDSAKRFERPKSELKSSFLRIFLVCAIISVSFALVSVLTWVLQTVLANKTIGFEDYHFFAIRLSGSLTAMIPAGLYLLTSIALTVGVINLATKRMNVQELYCIEMLARVDVVCFDKTGTLTDGNLAFKEMFNFSSFSDSELRSFIASTVLGTGDDNETAKVLKGLSDKEAILALSAVPFDSARKYSAATLEGVGTFVIGAAEFINGKAAEEGRLRLRALSKGGYRSLAVFFSKKPIKENALPSNLEMVAVIGIADHLKEDAKENIKWFVDNGVMVKVISGDDPVTVSQIAVEAGVPGAAKYISMNEVNDDDIPAIAREYAVFGRVRPEQKAKLIEAIQADGHKVAMTGDGVNDIVALKKADCSIAMASGSAAARNVSHMVSLDNNFSRLPDVVAEGRRVINNLQRTSALFLTKTAFAMIMSLAFLVSTWANGPAYPFTTKNMMIWETLTIGLGGFLLALQPTKDRISGSFVKNVLMRAAPAGAVIVLAVLTVFVVRASLGDGFMAYSTAISAAVTVFSFLSFFVLFRICLPLNTYRSIVFFGLLTVGLIAFGLDVGLGFGIFGINTSGFTPAVIGMIVGTILGFGSAYLFGDLLISKTWGRGKNGVKEKEKCESGTR